MSGSLNQGLPQRMTAFVDPATGLVSETWWRFLSSLWTRSGGAAAPSSIGTIAAEVDALTGLVLGLDVSSDAELFPLLAVLFDESPAIVESDPAAWALMVSDA